MLFHIFAHVNADQRVHTVKQLAGQLLHQLGFAHARGAHKDKAGRAAASAQIGTAALDGLTDQVHGLLLADHLLIQVGLQIAQLFKFAFLDLYGGNARPKLDHPGQILHGHADAAGFQLQCRQLVTHLGKIGFHLCQLLIVDGFAGAGVFQGAFALLQLGQLAAGLNAAADLGMAQIAAGAGFVQKVNGLIRQISIGDIALGKAYRGGQHIAGHLHAVVLFIVALDALHHGQRIAHAGLFHLNGLEAAFQRLIFFNEFAVFVKGGGADHLNFAAGKSRLHNVARIHSAFAVTRSRDVVNLVNKQNNVAVSAHFAQKALHALFKLPAELRACHQRRKVQQVDFLVFQAGGHIPGCNALGNALGNGGFAHTGFTDQAGVVFLAAAQDLNGAVNFTVAADHIVQLACLGLGGKVVAVVIQKFALAGFAAFFAGLGLFVGIFAVGAHAKRKSGAAARQKAVLLAFLAVAVGLGIHHHAKRIAPLACFLHEIAHALFHVFQVFIRNAETLHQILYGFNAQLTRAGKAVALLLGVAGAVHALHKHDRRALFTADTKHCMLPPFG